MCFGGGGSSPPPPTPQPAPSYQRTPAQLRADALYQSQQTGGVSDAEKIDNKGNTPQPLGQTSQVT